MLAGRGCGRVTFCRAQLASDLRAFEPAAKSGVGDVVVGGQPSQRLAGRPAAHELGVGGSSETRLPHGMSELSRRNGLSLYPKFAASLPHRFERQLSRSWS